MNCAMSAYPLESKACPVSFKAEQSACAWDTSAPGLSTVTPAKYTKHQESNIKTKGTGGMRVVGWLYVADYVSVGYSW